jgi:hypothetical protein
LTCKNFLGQSPKSELVGGNNITPREVSQAGPILNDAGFVCDKNPYKKLVYRGTDPFVHAKLANSSQGISQIKKSNSVIKLRQDPNPEDIINRPGFIRSSYGKNFRVSNNYMGGRQQGTGYWNDYDPECEPGLTPHGEFEDDAA